MNDLTPVTTLAARVTTAAERLAKAETHAEVLDVRIEATATFGATKIAARLAKAKGAHDELIRAIYRVQADALDIEHIAKRRLADEYDAAQARGEVGQRTGRPPKDVPAGNDIPPTAADLGLSRREVHDARLVRDAEVADPGVVRRTLDETLQRGEEPTRAAIREAVLEAAREGLKPERRPARHRPTQKPERDPQFELAIHVGAECAHMVERVGDQSPEYILDGFLDDAMRQRAVEDIRQCRDLLTRIVETADAKR